MFDLETLLFLKQKNKTLSSHKGSLMRFEMMIAIAIEITIVLVSNILFSVLILIIQNNVMHPNHTVTLCKVNELPRDNIREK